LLTLASRSPQRRAILERLGLTPLVVVPEVEEIEQGDPVEVAIANARRKARAVRDAGHREPVLGADTVVALDGALFGKPADEPAARAMLRALGGRTHTVVGGFSLLAGEREHLGAASTEVSFRELDERLLDWYLATGEWRERAGGYAIQGAGAALVREVRGDYENVVGLPLAALLDDAPELLAEVLGA
jgi:nucleoside triphosphate pyrophosphatase